MVPFGQPVGQRAEETHTPPHTLYRRAARFAATGMASLFAPPRTEKHRRLPAPISAAMRTLKAEHPSFHAHEIAPGARSRVVRDPLRAAPEPAHSQAAPRRGPARTGRATPLPALPGYHRPGGGAPRRHPAAQRGVGREEHRRVPRVQPAAGLSHAPPVDCRGGGGAGQQGERATAAGHQGDASGHRHGQGAAGESPAGGVPRGGNPAPAGLGVWRYGPPLFIEHREEALAGYRVTYEPGKRRRKTITLHRLFETPFRPPHPWPFLLDDAQWRKAWRTSGYAPRPPGRVTAARLSLFPHGLPDVSLA